MTTILYVEDDEKLSFVTKDQLEKNNYIVDNFTNGYSALKGFKKKKYDICILDVMLPIIDGFSLAKKIRQINEETINNFTFSFLNFFLFTRRYNHKS